MFTSVRQRSSKTMVTMSPPVHFSHLGRPSVLGSPVRAKFTKAPRMTFCSCSQFSWWQTGTIPPLPKK